MSYIADDMQTQCKEAGETRVLWSKEEIREELGVDGKNNLSPEPMNRLQSTKSFWRRQKESVPWFANITATNPLETGVWEILQFSQNLLRLKKPLMVIWNIYIVRQVLH